MTGVTPLFSDSARKCSNSKSTRGPGLCQRGFLVFSKLHETRVKASKKGNHLSCSKGRRRQRPGRMCEEVRLQSSGPGPIQLLLTIAENRNNSTRQRQAEKACTRKKGFWL
ncbi:Hypothetical protein NTJ_00782 [Nesidiocoris tenuis]|uniref:Uncharacterized protein n=1 Tax=Nesidiocoris tenuis TaxID=355587 RepID=A0ABN7AAT0_9HEMI|nr:Hypothetical protein NTJ_00782 [Nesidiocoris tenuis]